MVQFSGSTSNPSAIMRPFEVFC